MAKKYCHFWSSVWYNRQKEQSWDDFVASDIYVLRGQILQKINNTKPDELYQLLTEKFKYDKIRDDVEYLSNGRTRYYTLAYTRPVIETFYIENKTFFGEMVRLLATSADAALCESFIKALDHKDVTDIKVKTLYSLDKIRVEKALKELSDYSNRTFDGTKKATIKSLYEELQSEWGRSGNKDVSTPKGGIYPLLPTEGNLFVERVKNINKKMRMTKVLHKHDAILEKHQDLKLIRIIGDLVVALGSGFMLNIINKGLTGHWSFFNQATSSMQRVDAVDKALFTDVEPYEGMSRLTQ